MKIFKSVLALSVLLALLAACGDESSSSAPDPIGEISSSSNDDNGSASSSSQKDSKKSSSSVSEKNSSSSVSGKNSSSSVVESSSSARNSSSSSAILFKQCEEGEQKIVVSEIDTGFVSCKDGKWVVDSIVDVVKPKVYPNMDSVFNPAVTYGSFRDPRDGKVYKTVRYYIKLQSGETTFIDSFTVMAQNLNYADTTIDSTTTVFDDSKVEKRCYQDDPWYCDNYFGALYTWSEALGLPKVCDSVGVTDDSRCNIKLGYDAKVQGVCPEGWHVMNETEWKHFASPRGIDASYTMLSRAVWENEKKTNSSGMSLLPNGDENPSNGLATFWLPEEKADDGLGAIIVNISSSLIISPTYKKGALPVRCVMDEGDTFIK
ncbi:major paralogous domain-containing protein [Fibrobacter sp. UWB15]|uniref:FISUMP domain-containing protein n=1 Tax=unclassified Fibrobacter TaxID=2634177 RepID=UPI000914FB6B|nr:MULTISPECIES: FISUMP domain-containing protein [unclassified Fibrobacter]PWJ67505.1 uncharacterized protein (TIGR02145 family) [Fibrobacter sp. UWB6]SHF69343.1 major paralogous domain-containing protein [Fibrobacter sp. UWB8]SMG11515.1 major paralogous domain-containing protein [Fibrobacter sp. UWB15]